MKKIVVFLLFVFFKGAYFQDNRKLTMANNKLGFDLFQHLEENVNFFFSPISISTALGMIYAGAKDKTEEEMRTVLGYEYAHLDSSEITKLFQEYLSSVESSSNYTLEIANSVLVQKDFPLEPIFENILTDHFNVLLKQVDFANNAAKITQEINDWVKQKTHSKITKLLEENLEPDTRMFLLNAVYFKGTWWNKFDEEQTEQILFFNKGDVAQKKKIPMMNIEETFNICYKENFAALQLPYKGKFIHMLVILPNENDGLRKIEKRFNSDNFTDVLQSLEPRKVEVSIPKFKIEYSIELTEVLNSLGMNSALSLSANFSGISQQPGLYVSKVLHKSFFAVNEEGSEAAAITGVQVCFFSMASESNVFLANHPFMFFIYDSRNDLILFSGRLTQM